MIYYFAALSASMLWALSAVIAKKPVNYFGGLGFNCLRMNTVMIFLAVVTFAGGLIHSLSSYEIMLVLISGVFGIFLGDTFLFSTMDRLGPRRTSILFATNAPITALMGFFVYGEIISRYKLIGIGIIFIGLILAIVYGSGKANPHKWDAIRGRPWEGLLLGLLAAFCQSLGIIMMKPIMVMNYDPFFMSLLRVGAAVLCLNTVYFMRQKKRHSTLFPLNVPMLSLTAISGILGMAVGMTMVLFALKGGESGLVAALSSLTPVMILPVIWAGSRQQIHSNAWIGAVAVCIGTAIILNS